MLQWHPINTKGEGCEHIFSALNELARSICHATRFHHHQAIEEHFSFWNADKYEALMHFIRNHYREAIETVRSLSAELAVLKSALNLSNEDFQHFLSEELAYLNSIHQPPLHEQLCVLSNTAIIDPATATLALRNAWIECELTFMKMQNTATLLAHLQTQLGLDSLWIIGSDEYNLYKEEARLGLYHKALGELEQLVVMRLFELMKFSLSGTGKLQ
ncbi:hypothetical protein HD554DRAFT_2205859 [Boletus coccyginus]|nr:hypothetical protein HD554DRAFT_2205859 [Boletus coccyginus]